MLTLRSTYLFMSKTNSRYISSNNMEKYSSSDSDISLDSLETKFRKETSLNNVRSEDNVETILVPFYEKDVLIKVPKEHKKMKKHTEKNNEKTKKRNQQAINSYLINKEKAKRTTYLERFRKQTGIFLQGDSEKEKKGNEIRSISPECGDTERESMGEEISNPVTDYFNTECYNELYYEKLLTQNEEKYLDNSFEEDLGFNEDVNLKSPDAATDHFHSVSEVSQNRHHTRRATTQPIQNVKLGGLGPDVERIKPRLERARSLQRYSEKIRMENRVKIYKKSIQADKEKKNERELSETRRDKKDSCKESPNQYASYLINKTEDRKMKIVSKIYNSKSKSADVQKTRERAKEKEQLKAKINRNENSNNERGKCTQTEKREQKSVEKDQCNASGLKTSSRSRGMKKGPKHTDDATVPPVQISFLVNVGGVRPSSALKSLEEKHRMYQERVKRFSMDNNDS